MQVARTHTRFVANLLKRIVGRFSHSTRGMCLGLSATMISTQRVSCMYLSINYIITRFLIQKLLVHFSFTFDLVRTRGVLKENCCFSRDNLTDDVSELRGFGNATAVRAACESDFTAYFRTDVGMTFKNEFCVLCNFPVSLDVLRNCKREKSDIFTNIYDMTMFLNVDDMHLVKKTTEVERSACTTVDGVS